MSLYRYTDRLLHLLPTSSEITRLRRPLHRFIHFTKELYMDIQALYPLETHELDSIQISYFPISYSTIFTHSDIYIFSHLSHDVFVLSTLHSEI